MAHADFRGTPTYFAAFKMMNSSKNLNQNMLKIPYFFEEICKNSQLASSGWGSALRPPPPCDLTQTYCTVTNVLSLSSFLMKILRR